MQRKKLSLPSLPIRASVSAATTTVTATTTAPAQTPAKKKPATFGTDITNSATKKIKAEGTSAIKETPARPTIVCCDREGDEIISGGAMKKNLPINHHHNMVTMTPTSYTNKIDDSALMLTTDDEETFVLGDGRNKNNKSSKSHQKIIVEETQSSTTASSTSTASSATNTASSTSSSSTSNSSTLAKKESLLENREPAFAHHEDPQCNNAVTPPQSQAMMKDDEESYLDTDNFELTEDFLSPPQQQQQQQQDHSKSVSSSNKQGEEKPVAIVVNPVSEDNKTENHTKATSSSTTTPHHQTTTTTKPQPVDQDELLLLRAQIRRLQLENSRLSEESSFFKEAATNMKQQAIFGKQQLMTQLECFTEPLMRQEIEEEFEESVREFIFSHQFIDQKFFIETIAELKKERDEWKREAKKFSERLIEVGTIAKTSSQEKKETETPSSSSSSSSSSTAEKDLVSLRKATKEMCKSWQNRFNALKSENNQLEEMLNETRKELISLKNVASFVENKQKEKRENSLVKDTGCDPIVIDDSSVLISELEKQEATERNEKIKNEEEQDFTTLFDLEKYSRSLAETLTSTRKECDKKISMFSSEAAKFKSRVDQVSSECEVLVEENTKLHHELSALRKENFRF